MERNHLVYLFLLLLCYNTCCSSTFFSSSCTLNNRRTSAKSAHALVFFFQERNTSMSIYKSPLSASKVYTLAEGIYGTLLAVSAVMRDHLDFLRSSLYPDQRRPGTESRENRRESECRTTKICRPLKAVEVRAMDNLIRRIRSINPTGFRQDFRPSPLSRSAESSVELPDGSADQVCVPGAAEFQAQSGSAAPFGACW
jgi:hypothetical protein